MKESPLIIAGGGIGGLAAGVALRKLGQPVRIIEQAGEFRPIGYGIQLGPNAFRAFERLGLATAVLERCSLPNEGLLKDAVSGATLLRLPMASEMQARFGYPYAVIHRADLHEVLVDACRETGVDLLTDCELQSFEDEGQDVILSTSHGAMRTSGLIAADGIWSKTRAALTGSEPPQRLGYAVFRSVRPLSEVPQQLAKNAVILWAGPGCHMIHYPLRGGTLFNLVAAFDYKINGDAEAGMSLAERLLSRFSTCHDDIRQMLPYLDLDQHWEIATVEPIATWCKGRVTLLGDSAHAMVQALAQGACQAIEDALSLAEHVSASPHDLVNAFRAFNRSRLLRVTRVQYMSRLMWEIIHVRGAYAELRNERLKAHDNALEELSWLYDADRSSTDKSASSERAA